MVVISFFGLIMLSASEKTERTKFYGGLSHLFPSSKSTSRKNIKERGLVLVELALVAPVMLLILVGIFEVSCYLNEYFKLKSIAYEGARFAASRPSIGKGYAVEVGNETRSSVIDGSNVAQYAVLDRVNSLLRRQKPPRWAGYSNYIEPEGSIRKVETLCGDEYEPCIKKNNDTGEVTLLDSSVTRVKVEVSVPYKSIFNFAVFIGGKADVTITETTPYLIRN